MSNRNLGRPIDTRRPGVLGILAEDRELLSKGIGHEFTDDAVSFV